MYMLTPSQAGFFCVFWQVLTSLCVLQQCYRTAR